MRRIPTELVLLSALLAGCEANPSAAPSGAGLRGARGPTVGQAAPNITGVDIDGTPFQLADYRGKVVMLDFWGLW